MRQIKVVIEQIPLGRGCCGEVGMLQVPTQGIANWVERLFFFFVSELFIQVYKSNLESGLRCYPVNLHQPTSLGKMTYFTSHSIYTKMI